MSGPGHPLASNSPGQLFIPFPSPQSAIVQGPQFAATASSGGGHVSPAAQSTMIQFIGVSQPIASTGPAQLDMTNPQWGCLRGGQTYGHSSPSAMQMSGIGHALWSKLPGQLFIPSPQSTGDQGMQLSAAASAGGGHCSPAAQSTMIQFIGVSQPFASTGPGQLDMTNPQWGCSTCGQKNGHSSPSATQISGIGHPIGSVSPGQLLMPSPQSAGGKGGQSWAGIARAVEMRVKSRRDISRLSLLGSSVFPAPHGSNLYPHARCDLFAPLKLSLSVLELSPSFYLAPVHIYTHYFFSPLVWEVCPSNQKSCYLV